MEPEDPCSAPLQVCCIDGFPHQNKFPLGFKITNCCFVCVAYLSERPKSSAYLLNLSSSLPLAQLILLE